MIFFKAKQSLRTTNLLSYFVLGTVPHITRNIKVKWGSSWMEILSQKNRHNIIKNQQYPPCKMLWRSELLGVCILSLSIWVSVVDRVDIQQSITFYYLEYDSINFRILAYWSLISSLFRFSIISKLLASLILYNHLR